MKKRTRRKSWEFILSFCAFFRSDSYRSDATFCLIPFVSFFLCCGTWSFGHLGFLVGCILNKYLKTSVTIWHKINKFWCHLIKFYARGVLSKGTAFLKYSHGVATSLQKQKILCKQFPFAVSPSKVAMNLYMFTVLMLWTILWLYRCFLLYLA